MQLSITVSKKILLNGNLIHGDAPPNNVKVWYVAVRDERKAIASSELILP